ncbi:MAG: Fibronectin type domain protein [Pedosphaera sp.]|nr:Fibronectin type domain protein [Pedosphaera sp.]
MNAMKTPLILKWLLFVAFAFPASLTGQTQQACPAFTSIHPGLPRIHGSSVAWGDYDNDGKLDILLTGLTNNNLNSAVSQLWRNLGNGTFTNLNAGLPGIAYGSAAWSDFDNDGRLDILLTGTTNGNSSGAVSQLWRNLGNGTFTNLNAGLPGIAYGSVAWGDFDNDGKPDILLAGLDRNGSPISQIWRNVGNGSFTNINAALPGLYLSSVAWGDFDNDGNLDILLTGMLEVGFPISLVLLNEGEGNFTVVASLPGVEQGSVAWGDFDNDGRLDILLTGVDEGGQALTQVWWNLGFGYFYNLNAGLPGVWQSSVAWGDYDNDGRLDILLTGTANNPADAGSYNPISQVWRNLGDGTFTNITAGLPGVYSGSVAWGDSDGDGNLDILLTGALSNNVSSILQVWRNNTIFTNSVPAVPTGLAASITTSGVILTWYPATDGQTPVEGLSYNLRVGTTSGNSNILSAQADSIFGLRRVPKLGNAQLRLITTLTNLSPGNYYWSVQAVDTAFAGSLFAKEESFTLGPPNIIAITQQINGNLQLDFGGSTAPWYVLQSSTNLTEWTDIFNFAVNPNGQFQFIDNSATNFPVQFYRLKQP